MPSDRSLNSGTMRASYRNSPWNGEHVFRVPLGIKSFFGTHISQVAKMRIMLTTQISRVNSPASAGQKQMCLSMQIQKKKNLLSQVGVCKRVCKNDLHHGVRFSLSFPGLFSSQDHCLSLFLVIFRSSLFDL